MAFPTGSRSESFIHQVNPRSSRILPRRLVTSRPPMGSWRMACGTEYLGKMGKMGKMETMGKRGGGSLVRTRIRAYQVDLQ